MFRIFLSLSHTHSHENIPMNIFEQGLTSALTISKNVFRVRKQKNLSWEKILTAYKQRSDACFIFPAILSIR